MKAGLLDLASVLETGTGTVGVKEAATLTVLVAIVGAVHANAVQLHVIGLRVTTIVEVEPVLVLQFSSFVVIVKVTVVVDAMKLPYCAGSIVSFFEPGVAESVIDAQVVTAVPSAFVMA